MKRLLFFLLLASTALVDSLSAQQVLSISPLGNVQASIDFNGWKNFRLTLTQNVTFQFVGIPLPQQGNISVFFVQNAVGGFTVTFNSFTDIISQITIKIVNTCVIATAANAVTICQYTFDNTTNTWISTSTGSGAGTPGGSNTQLQINNSGAFGAIANVAAGSAFVSNGASSLPIFQSKPAIDVRDFGVDCTDTNDSTTAFANAITAAGNFGKIIVPKNCKFKISGATGVSLYKVQGLEIEFQGRQGNSCDQGGSAGIDYTQAYAGGNTVVSVIDSQRLLFKNMVIYTNGGADNALLIDQDLLTPPINTDNIFQNTCIFANTATRNSSFRGISISPTSASNVENIHISTAVVTCSTSAPTSNTSNGVGVFVGASSNAVNETLDYITGTNCSQTIGGGGGQEVVYSHILDSTGTANTNVTIGALNAGLVWSRFENGNIGVSQTGGSPVGPMLIMGNDFTNTATVMDCSVSGCGTNVTVINNQKDTVPANWFNNHGNTSGNLFAVNNRNFSWNPTDWISGAFVFPDLTLGTSSPRATLTESLFLTPYRLPASIGGNFGSPFVMFENTSGGTPQLDDWLIESMPTGAASFGAASSSTFVINHVPGAISTTWVALAGTQSGATFNAIASPVFMASPITAHNCSGAGTWSYQAVAHGSVGTTTASATISTGATACTTLNSTSYLVISIPMVAGCTTIDIYRTVSGGTPSTTGKIGSIACGGNNSLQAIGGWEEASLMRFEDNGLAGDASSPPGTNTTGFVNAVVGIQQNGNAIGQNCGTTSTCTATAAPLARTVYGSAPLVSGTPSAVTVTGFSPAFTSTSTFFCTVSNATTQSNPVKVVNASASSITITGPNTVSDTVNYICIGT